MPSNRTWEIIQAFQKYLKNGDKGLITVFSKDELEFALNECARFKSDSYYAAMERRYAELKEEESLKKYDEEILLEDEQKELLIALVEASRNVPREDRAKFFVANDLGGTDIIHKGLPGGKLSAYLGDVEALSNENLLFLRYGPQGTPHFDVTPKGFKYYETLKHQISQPSERVEDTVKKYLSSVDFKGEFLSAYQKWESAELLLWKADSTQQLTTIGHLCREAIQEFA